MVLPELAKGFGFLQGKPASALSPVLVTPDELQPYWRGGKLHRPMQVWLNDRLIGQPQAGEEMQFHFGELIAHAARTRRLGGTLLGSGTISNASDAAGVCCWWKRACAKLRDGEMRTPFLKHGDRVRIGMRDDAGASLFGDIDRGGNSRHAAVAGHGRTKPPQPERSARWPNPLRSPCCTATGAARPPTACASRWP